MTSIFAFLIFIAAGVFVLLRFIIWLRQDGYVRHATKLSMNGKGEEAIRYLRGIVEQKGPTVERLNLLGLLLMDQNRLAESLEQFDRCESIFGMNSGASNNRAVVLQRMGRIDEALAAFARVTETYPSEFMSLCNHASLLADVGRENEAYGQLGKAEALIAGKDARYLPEEWKAALAECRSKLPLTQGFEVLPKKPA